MLTQTLNAEGVSSVIELAPGQSAAYSATTADLDEATLLLQQSRNGYVWEAARDQVHALVADVVGSGGAESSTAVLRNVGTGPLRFRAALVETDTLAGTVAIVFTARNDVVRVVTDNSGNPLVSFGDENVTVHVPLVDANGETLLGAATLGVEAGVGITGTAAAYATSVVREGGLIRTRIYVDIQGLNGGGTANDIIGANGAGVAHLGQITNAVNGAIVAGSVFCAEVPTTSDPDVDLWSANEATGVEDTLVTDLTGEVQLTNGGDHTLARTIALIGLPVSGQYLYLTGGDATAGTYGAGKFVIELIGLPV